MEDVLHTVMPHLPARKRKTVAKKLFDAFEGEDCDTLYECRGLYPEFDEVLDEAYPVEDEDD